MKIDKILPALRSTTRIKKVDSRRKNNQQPPFSNLLKENNEEKKKEKHGAYPDLTSENERNALSQKNLSHMNRSKIEFKTENGFKPNPSKRRIDICV